MARAALADGNHVSHSEPDFWGSSPFQLWYAMTVGGLGPGGAERPQLPGLRGPTERVLLVMLDGASGGALVKQSLVHATVITLALAVLVVLTVLQVRTIAREQRLAAERAAEKRFAALGRLSAVLAHEIRNPLGAIKGFAQYTAKRFAPEDPAHGDMEAVIAESTRLERLVHSLLLYARPTEPRRVPTDVRDVVKRAVRLIEREAADAEIDIRTSLPETAACARVDGAQLEQAVLNLLANAVEAMAEDGGQLDVAVVEEDGEIGIDVEDRGPGIAPELLAEIFVPYVTQKARGTGLGLAVVDRVVRAHDGRVTIDTELGRGTTMSVHLPAGSAAGRDTGVDDTGAKDDA